MRRTALIVLAAAAGLIALILVAVAIAVATVDLHTLIGPVQARVKSSTGRDLTINGPIGLKLSLEPKILLADVTFTNAAGSKVADMVRAKRVEVRVALLPLLSRRFEVVELTLTDPVIVLETDARGRANWDFGSPSSVATTTRAIIDHLAVHARRGDAPVEAEFRGKIDDFALTLTGNLGPIDALRAGRWPYPVAAKGTFDEKPAAITTKLAVQGDTIQLDDLDLTFGSFKAKGKLSVASASGRKRYTFELTTPAIVLADVPIPAGHAPAATAARPPSNVHLFFSDEPLPLDALKSFDAAGHLSMAAVTLKNGMKLADVDISLTLREGKLDVARWQANALGGTLSGKLSLDTTHAEAPALATKLTGRNLDLAAILAAVGEPRQTRGGATTIDVDIAARGVSPHAWASSASGTVLASVGPATLINTKLDLDNALDKLAQAVNPFRERDPSTELQCAVVRLPLRDGIARVDRSIALDSKKFSASASGTLDFRNETLDLTLHPRIKQGIPIDIPQFAQLVRFTGPFAHPGVSIDAVASAATIAKIGAAIGTGGLSMIDTSLIARATDNENVCDVAAGRATPAAGPSAAAPKSSPAAAVPQDIGKALGKLFGG